MKKKNDKQPSGFLGVVIGIQIALVVILTLIFVVSVNRYHKTVYLKETDVERMITRERYADLNSDIHNTYFRIKNPSKEFNEFYNLSRYIDDAVLYNAYVVIGKENDAKYILDQMEDRKSKVGSYEFVTQKVDERILAYIEGK